MKRSLTVLIKPASSLCNMNCSYCFYRDLADYRTQGSIGIMKEDIAEQVVRKTLKLAEGGAVNFCFQGGEPLIAGVAYYQKFLLLVELNNVKKSTISYSLQTNGVLLDEEYCELFQKYRFLIGVSLDGKSDVHNRYRTTAEGKGTFNKVMQNIELLRQYNIEFNILSVVTRSSARFVQSNWNFYRKKNFDYLQYINCLEPLGREPFSTDYVMSNEDYFQFHKQLFDLYLEENKNGKFVSVRHLDNLMARLQGKNLELCDMQGYCAGQLVIEADGSMYPCDFYCEDQYYMGNIRDVDVNAIAFNPVLERFVQSSRKVDESCKACDVFAVCRGGCRRERVCLSDGELGLNMYCEGRKRFFTYVLERVRQKRK